MAKILDCGKNGIAGPVSAHGFGMGSNKTKAKQAASNTVVINARCSLRIEADQRFCYGKSITSKFNGI